jgi:sn1-specific diacylglycerol lipase
MKFDFLSLKTEIFYLFKGMHSAANYIYDDIATRLTDIFTKYPDYTLIICGYSLGAGIASILAILFKPTYPHLKCYGIAMPGSVLSENLVSATRHFIYSYVVDVDMIGRASIRSLEHLRDRIIDALNKCNRSKIRVLTMTLAHTLTKRRQAFHSMNSRTQVLMDESLLPAVTTIDVDSSISQIVSTNRSNNEREHLVMPGTIIHLYSTNRVGLFSRRISYRACMSTYNQFAQLIVHPRMWLDHFPASYSTALTDAIENYDQILQDIK